MLYLCNLLNNDHVYFVDKCYKREGVKTFKKSQLTTLVFKFFIQDWLISYQHITFM